MTTNFRSNFIMAVVMGMMALALFSDWDGPAGSSRLGESELSHFVGGNPDESMLPSSMICEEQNLVNEDHVASYRCAPPPPGEDPIPCVICMGVSTWSGRDREDGDEDLGLSFGSPMYIFPLGPCNDYEKWIGICKESQGFPGIYTCQEAVWVGVLCSGSYVHYAEQL